MNILENAVSILNQQLYEGVDPRASLSVLTSAQGEDDSGGLDPSGLVTRMTREGGLMDAAKAFLQ
jgi:hypothetical protein